MNGPPSPFRPEALLAHREWVERAARALVYGDADAEDLGQQVWLETLEKPPARGPASPRGWLWSVLRFTAIDAGRSARTRRRHEQAASRPERIDASPAELVARAETLDRVAHAVLELEEPYRATVLLRYFEGMESRAIADLQGIPVETVRTRLKRAVERLRERLDAENGGKRRTWALALLPMLRRPPVGAGGGGAGAAAAATAGVLIMAVKTKVAVAAAILVLGVAGILLWPGWQEAPPTHHGPLSPPTVAVVPEPDRARPASPAAFPPATPPATLAGTVQVLLPDGTPAAGARLSFLPSGRETGPPVLLGDTGPDGRATWSGKDLPFPGLLRAEKEGFAPGDAAVAGEDGETVVRLAVGFLLEGEVLRRADRAPIPGAAIRIEYDRYAGPLGPLVGIHGTFTATARSDSDGTFRLPGLSTPSSALLSVSADGFAETRVSWNPGSPRPFVVELDRPLPLRVLLRAPSGKPLPGGAVVLGQDRRTLAWRDGMFGFGWVPLRDLGDGLYGAEGLAPGWYAVAGAHEGFRPADGGQVGVCEGGPPAEIVLEPAAGVQGRAVDAVTGAPLAGVRVRAMAFLLGEGKPNVSWNNTLEAAEALGEAVAAVSAADGSFALSTVSPGDPLLLVGELEGYLPFATRLDGADADAAVEVRLRPLGSISIRGRVLDGEDAPVPGALIRWEGVSGRPSGAAAAGPDGRFLVEGLTEGQYPVALAPGFLPTVLEAPSTVAGGDYGDILLVRSREVPGRVVDGSGAPVPGVSLQILPQSPGEGGRGPRSPIPTRVVASDGEGGVLLPLEPGRTVSLQPMASAPWTGTIVLPAEDPGPFTLVLAPKAAAGSASVRGRALDEEGLPMREMAMAMIWTEEGEAPAGGIQPARVGPDGSFVLELIPAGTWRVVVQSGERTGEVRGVVLAEGGTAEVAVACAPRPKADPAQRSVDLRVAPAGVAARAVTAWATEGDRRSRPFRVKGEELVASVRAGGAWTVWLSDPSAGTAAVASRIDPGDAAPVPVSLAPAGRLVLVPRGDGKERWVVLKDAAGIVPWSGLETSLPGVAGKGYVALLPPGEYEMTLSLGLARRDPETRRVVVRVGEETTVE